MSHIILDDFSSFSAVESAVPSRLFKEERVFRIGIVTQNRSRWVKKKTKKRRLKNLVDNTDLAYYEIRYAGIVKGAATFGEENTEISRNAAICDLCAA